MRRCAAVRADDAPSHRSPDPAEARAFLNALPSHQTCFSCLSGFCWLSLCHTSLLTDRICKTIDLDPNIARPGTLFPATKARFSLRFNAAGTLRFLFSWPMWNARESGVHSQSALGCAGCARLPRPVRATRFPGQEWEEGGGCSRSSERRREYAIALTKHVAKSLIYAPSKT